LVPGTWEKKQYGRHRNWEVSGKERLLDQRRFEWRKSGNGRKKQISNLHVSGGEVGVENRIGPVNRIMIGDAKWVHLASKPGGGA